MQSRIAYLCVLAVLSWTTALQAQTTIYTWNFGTTSADAFPTASNPNPNFSVGSFGFGQQRAGGAIDQTTPSNYSGASGQFNANVATIDGPLNTATSTFMNFSVTPTNGNSGVNISNISFGSRSNDPQGFNAGPTTVQIFASVDNFATSIAVTNPQPLSGFNTWDYYTAVITNPSIVTTTNTPIDFRIYAYGTAGNSSSVDWLVDDFSITLTPVPEPGTILGIGAVVMGMGAFVRRKFTKTVSQPQLAVAV